MTMRLSCRCATTAALALTLSGLAPAHAGPPDSSAIDWHSIDAGGGTSSGGPFVIAGAIGQHDIAQSSGGSFCITGGFWPGLATPCPGDADNSGSVNFADISAVLTFFGLPPEACHGKGDSNHDGVVNFSDITNVLTLWLQPCS